MVEDRAGQEAAEGHSEDRRCHHEADARPCLARRQVVPDDHGVHWHDAALEQAEYGADHVQRR